MLEDNSSPTSVPLGEEVGTSLDVYVVSPILFLSPDLVDRGALRR